MKLKAHAIDKVGEWTPIDKNGKGGLNVTDKYAFQHGKHLSQVLNPKNTIVYII